MTPTWSRASTITVERVRRVLAALGAALALTGAGPVDWHPWDERTFAKARREDKPVFLSIGYPACHWCRVMERESFSDPLIAARLGSGFVAVKVDREERPDVDRVYMDAAAAAGWGGGWPLNLWLTPELKPFFGGTYFPPRARDGRPGLLETLARVEEAWRDRREDARRDADDVARALEAYVRADERPAPAGAATLDAGYAALEAAYDRENGGFGDAPKFPRPSALAFLLRYHARTGRAAARDVAASTLLKMADGGIHDRLGGGFHRYATDARWRLPHFEKMLYDNAQLASLYLEAHQATGDPRLARVARETLDYLLRDLARPGGGFYSAQDADGAFYLWRRGEVTAALGERDGARVGAYYGVEAGPGVLSVVGAAAPPDLDAAHRRLLKARAARPRPRRDEKILTAWNGLALSALAKGAQVLDEPRYLRAAERTAEFLRARLADAGGGRLRRSWREGETAVPGFAEDYALLAAGLLDLYETSFDRRWLDWAARLAEEQTALFYDARSGGFHSTAPGDAPELLLRPLEAADGDLPAAGSVATLDLLRLSRLLDRDDLAQAAAKALAGFGGRLASRPDSLPAMLCALDYKLSEPLRVELAGERGAADVRALAREVHRRFLPDRTVLLAPRAGRAKATVCRGSSCSLPTADPAELGRLLDGRSVAK